MLRLCSSKFFAPITELTEYAVKAELADSGCRTYLNKELHSDSSGPHLKEACYKSHAQLSAFSSCVRWILRCHTCIPTNVKAASLPSHLSSRTLSEGRHCPKSSPVPHTQVHLGFYASRPSHCIQVTPGDKSTNDCPSLQTPQS